MQTALLIAKFYDTMQCANKSYRVFCLAAPHCNLFVQNITMFHVFQYTDSSGPMPVQHIKGVYILAHVCHHAQMNVVT